MRPQNGGYFRAWLREAPKSWHRAKASVENRIKEAKLGLGLDNLPSQRYHANWAYLLITLIAYNLLCWLKLLALAERERGSYAKRLRFRFIAVAASVGRSGRRLVLRLSADYALLADFLRALERIRGLARAPDSTAAPATDSRARSAAELPSRATVGSPHPLDPPRAAAAPPQSSLSAPRNRPGTRPQPLTAGSG